MSGQIATIRSVAFVVLLLSWDVGIGVPARADDCLTAPGSSTPKESHWYYRTDRAKGQKCWYLRSLGEPAQQLPAQDKSAGHEGTGAVEKPATEPTPISTDASDNTPALPPPEAQPVTISDTTPREPVEKPIQGEDPVSSSAEMPNPSVPWQGTAPAPAPSATATWPDPPAVRVLPANLAPNNERPASVPPVSDSEVSHDSNNAVQGAASITPPAKVARSSMGTLAEILLVVAIGLMLVALLYRTIMKIVVARDEQIIIRHELEWIGDRVWRALRRAKQPHQSVDALNQLTGMRHAGENKFAQLIQEFDQFAQSRKEA